MGVLGDWRHKDLTICHIIEERQIRKGWKERVVNSKWRVLGLPRQQERASALA